MPTLIPLVQSIAPISGSIQGGTAVTITGSNFVAGCIVKFGDVLATNVVFGSATQVTCNSPAVADFQTVIVSVGNIDVDNPGEYVFAAESAAKFMYHTDYESPALTTQNPFFDPNGSYTFYNKVYFAQEPIIGGPGPIPVANAWLLDGNSDATPISILGTTNATPVSLQSNGFDNIILDPDGATTLGYDPQNQIKINSASPTMDIESTSLSLNVNELLLAGVPSVVTASQLYWDPISFRVTTGPVGTTGFLWRVDGNNSGATLKLGTNSAEGWQYVVNSVPFCTINSVGETSYNNNVVIGGNFDVLAPSTITMLANFTATLQCNSNLALGSLAAQTTITAQNNIVMSSSNGGIDVSAPGNILINASIGNVHLTTGPTAHMELTTTDLRIDTLPFLESLQMVYYDVVTKAVTRGNPPNKTWTIVRTQYTAPGAYVFTHDPTMRFCEVEIVGAGGSGSSPIFPDGGAGGGGGGYCRRVFDNIELFGSQAVTVGAGGAPVAGASAGNPGGQTDFDTFLHAFGGDGGNGGGGGAGGSAVGTTGTIAFPGAYGGGGTLVGGVVWAGSGGASQFVTNNMIISSVDTVGYQGQFGAGGGGAINVLANNNSGAGGDGAVFITEYCLA